MRFSFLVINPSTTNSNRHLTQYLAVLAAVFCSIGNGLHFGWLSSAQLKLLNGEMPFAVTKEETSYIAMIQPLGYLLGCPFGAFIADRIGRKPPLLLLAIPQITGWLLIAAARSISFIYLAKFIVGTGEGAMYTLLPMYIGEITEPSIRGRLTSFFPLGIVIGILIINSYGSYISLQTSACISIVIPLMFLITFIRMPESPYYHLMKGKLNDARKCLQTLRMSQNVEEELGQLQIDVQKQISEPGTFKDLFGIESNRRAFCVLIVLRALQQYSGVSAVNFYSQLIFQEAEGNVSPATSSILFSICQLGAVLLGSCMIDTIGRKVLYIGSSLGAMVCLIVEGTYFYLKLTGVDVSSITWLPVAGLLLYIFIFGVGLGITPTVMMGELFSASVKAKALGFMNITFAACMSSSAKVFQLLETQYGMWAPFFFFALCCGIGAIYGLNSLSETKGKTLGEIQQQLKGKPKRALDDDRV